MGLDSQRTRTLKAINTLHPGLKWRAFALYGFAKLHDMELLVTEGLRSMERQAALYAKGRTEEGPRVTGAKPGQSYHNYGLAFDFVVTDYFGVPMWDKTPWEMLGMFGESMGLEWGGRWKRNSDRPHLQLTLDTWENLLAKFPDGKVPDTYKGDAS